MELATAIIEDLEQTANASHNLKSCSVANVAHKLKLDARLVSNKVEELVKQGFIHSHTKQQSGITEIVLTLTKKIHTAHRIGELKSLIAQFQDWGNMGNLTSLNVELHKLEAKQTQGVTP